MAATVRAYHKEANAPNHARRAEGEVDRQKLVKIEKAIKSMLAAIEDGLYAPAMKAWLIVLEQEKMRLIARLVEAP